MVSGANDLYFRPGAAETRAALISEFVRSIRKHDATPLPVVLAYEFQNEPCYCIDAEPLSLTKGKFRYGRRMCSLSSATQFLRLSDDVSINWGDTSILRAVRTVQRGPRPVRRSGMGAAKQPPSGNPCRSHRPRQRPEQFLHLFTGDFGRCLEEVGREAAAFRPDAGVISDSVPGDLLSRLKTGDPVAVALDNSVLGATPPFARPAALHGEVEGALSYLSLPGALGPSLTE